MRVKDGMVITTDNARYRLYILICFSLMETFATATPMIATSKCVTTTSAAVRFLTQKTVSVTTTITMMMMTMVTVDPPGSHH